MRAHSAQQTLTGVVSPDSMPGAEAPLWLREQDPWVCTESRPGSGGTPAGDELKTLGAGSPRGLAAAGSLDHKPGTGGPAVPKAPSHLHPRGDLCRAPPIRPQHNAETPVSCESSVTRGKPVHWLVTNTRARQMCGISDCRAGCRWAGQ